MSREQAIIAWHNSVEHAITALEAFDDLLSRWCAGGCDAAEFQAALSALRAVGLGGWLGQVEVGLDALRTAAVTR